MRASTRATSVSVAIVAAMLVTALLVPNSLAGTGSIQIATDKPEVPSVVQIHLQDQKELDRLVATGVDVVEFVDRQTTDHIVTEVVVTPSQLARLHHLGFKSGKTVFTVRDWKRNLAERQDFLDKQGPIEDNTDTVKIIRADYFENRSGKFLNVEAKSSLKNAAGVQLLATWSNPADPTSIGGPASLVAFVDAGQYMYHRALVPVTARPATVTVLSTRTGTATAPVTDWLGAPPQLPPNGYQKDFIDHYMDPTEIYARIEELAARYPDLTEIIDLPYNTNGYRRKAQALIGASNAAASAVVVTSSAWGHEGGNDLSVQVVNPGAPSQPLTVSVIDKLISVSLSTDAAGIANSTAAQVVAAINATPESPVTAMTYRGNAGTGLVAVQAATALTDNLSGDTEETLVSQEPWNVRALRIGLNPDSGPSDKMGVLAYSQEHAREWVTPLVAVEAAERLLANYATDAKTKDLVDNLDIFIIPSVNPDGGHYSFHDAALQRKNMTNHCGPNQSDPANRNSWGVDNNRNYEVGSIFDGYSGASSSCTGETYSGPAEHSEPESRNVIWVADNFPNIKYSMNIHSHGGYFMWAPGAYKSTGRESLAPPPFDVESAFWGGARKVLQAIKDERGTVIMPGRTGPIADVLYSAAGNSADELYYENDIFAFSFEVGAQLWNATSRSWSDAGFQPTFANEGHDEAMEFASGLIALFEVALQDSRDVEAPTSDLVAKGSSWVFTTSEPAAVWYTTDGSTPTFANATRYDRAGIREGGQELTLPTGTVVKWFSVDNAGNVEGGYDPAANDHYRSKTV